MSTVCQAQSGVSMLPSSYRRLFSRTAIVSLLAVCSPVFAQQSYQILDRWTIGGDGGWDYLLADPGTHLLYVTLGPRVEILDTKTGKTVGGLAAFERSHGGALDDAG